MRTHLNQAEERGIRRQKGVVLVVALMFILVMSIVGVTAMQSTIMQERMAGNARDRNLAFQAAEAALRAGEDALRQKNPNTAVKNLQDALDDLDLDLAQWNGEQQSDSAVSVDGLDDQLAHDPVYYLDPPHQVRKGITLGKPDWRFIYTVTARGEGGTETAVVILQSVFEPPR